MKLLRFGARGHEKPGLLDGEGRIHDLSPRVADITPALLGPAQLARLREIDLENLPSVSGTVRLGVPVSAVGKIVCVGLNYRAHAAESAMAVPDEPLLFMKANTAVSGPNDPIVLPPGSRKADWEVELGVVIGSTVRNATEDRAMDAVAGFCVGNDVSERELQLERGGQWIKGKSNDTFAPLGPWLVTPDEIRDLRALAIWSEVNERRYQNGNTRDMLFSVPYLVSYISQFMTLEPGDVILTGTPPGVGLAQNPPVFLKAGDRVRLGIDGLGEQQQIVESYPQ